MITVEITMKGVLPLIMHSQRGMNPREPKAQALAELQSRRSKTLADRDAISDLEFELSLYYTDKLGPYVPYLAVKRSIEDGGKMLKLGTHVKEALHPCPTCLEFALIYEGPRGMAGLLAAHEYRDVRTVKVPPRTGKVVERTRAIFRQWGLIGRFLLDNERLDLRKLSDCSNRSGLYKGLLEYRPEYGLYEATVKEIEDGD